MKMPRPCPPRRGRGTDAQMPQLKRRNPARLTPRERRNPNFVDLIPDVGTRSTRFSHPSTLHPDDTLDKGEAFQVRLNQPDGGWPKVLPIPNNECVIAFAWRVSCSGWSNRRCSTGSRFSAAATATGA
jgi:hypothetical protein